MEYYYTYRNRETKQGPLITELDESSGYVC